MIKPKSLTKYPIRMLLIMLIVFCQAHASVPVSSEKQNLMAISAQDLAAQAMPEVTAKNLQLATDSINAFTVDLYSQLAEKSRTNLFLSPYSISTALAMTYAGAERDTRTQMAKALHFPQTEDIHSHFSALSKQLTAKNADAGYELLIANQLWGQRGFHFSTDFVETLNQLYNAALKELDFKNAAEPARKEINQWVEEQTHEKIKNLIAPGVLNALTRLVLTNAIYFKGLWRFPFDEKQTKPAPFLFNKARHKSVPMMSHQGKSFAYTEDKEVQVIELPYTSKSNGDKPAPSSLSMVVILPKQVDGLAALEKQFNFNRLQIWLKALQESTVDLSLPKFKLEASFMLKDYLTKMGMIDAFSAGKADFSGMREKGEASDLHISAVVHKAFVEVNEQGTEAAAATAVIVSTRSFLPPQKKVVFRADHPFIFLIRDNNSGTILFIGRVLDPEINS